MALGGVIAMRDRRFREVAVEAAQASDALVDGKAAIAP
jgi:hypothetical protein